MIKKVYYSVADLTFKLSLPIEKDVNILLPSFLSFRVDECEVCDAEMLFGFEAHDEHVTIPAKGALIEEAVNDMGCVRLLNSEAGYVVELCAQPGGKWHVMSADRRFGKVVARMQWDDEYVGEALCSMLRIVFSMAVIFRGGVSVHAAAVAWHDRAYMFMGKSGTGKSTHARLWMSHLPECELINDDNPAIRLNDGKVFLYGTPWSGKTPCYKNVRYILAGAVRLRQAGANRFIERTDVEAFTMLFPGCSVIRSDNDMCNVLYDTLAQVVGLINVGELECLPDEVAATLCVASLSRENLIKSDESD